MLFLHSKVSLALYDSKYKMSYNWLVCRYFAQQDSDSVYSDKFDSLVPSSKNLLSNYFFQ